ncbi:Hsp20/alpha crystallin family protein [Yoonia sediminilitoris]|uniref:HSP20 family protein n=1 Tax=Yoonia sediminilitoris TaxID=1286148 RepID=A0A2T6KC30_9RHOB|nr:Hsp20/alpha crystallin family protein [Yoonia sediminilitoris]PUB12433.1 HSP20 family protein [Yoonia sediminilitoris]RCW93127.1 HSP20 family protein [Yoonia sediminilitoris]
MQRSAFSPWAYHDPFADMRRLQGAMNRIFDGSRTPARSGTYPPVNFWAGQDSVVMSTELPGLGEQDIEMTVKDSMISIRGTYPDAETGDDIVWHRRERPAGSFLRSIELPFRVDPNQIDARFANGVLTVEMQRPEDDKPKHIQIKAS